MVVEAAVPDRRQHGAVLPVHQLRDVLLAEPLIQEIGVAGPLGGEHPAADVDQTHHLRVSRPLSSVWT